ncbi:MAG: hypothetical protein ACKV0T_17355 [Planctomycetales bacterium]
MHPSESLRFSIHLPRPLWIFLGTVAFVVMAIAVRIGLPIYRQRVAIREFERLGGFVELQNGGPVWLRRVVGDRWMTPFQEVVHVGLGGSQVTDSNLIHLEQMPNLEWLVLTDTQISDPGLVYLQGLNKLTILDLEGTQVTNAGLEHLKELTALQWLYLCRTEVTPPGVAKLQAALPSVRIR